MHKNRDINFYESFFDYFSILIPFSDFHCLFILSVPFLINTMVSIAEGIPLLGLHPELVSAALLVDNA